MKMRILAGLLFSIWAMLSLAAEISDVSVDRTYGLLIGDVITEKVTLPIAYEQLDPASLPQINKRYGTWLYLVALEADNTDMTLTYQVVNVPRQNEKVSTPEFSLRSVDDEFVTVPSTQITLGSLLPNASAGAASVNIPQPDHEPVLEDTSSIKQQLLLTVVVSVILIMILTAWHFGWKFKNRKPFAQAVHNLARLRWSRSVQANQAARLLHAAFNATAGTIVVQNNIDNLFIDVPWLQPLSTEIEQFYQQSQQHFFSRDSKQEPEFAMVMKLAKACRAKEKLA